MSDIQSKFRTNILYSVTSQLFVFALTFAYHVFCSRALGPEDLGVYTLLILAPLLFGRFAHLGVDAANTFFVGDSEQSKNFVISNSLVLILVSSSFAGLAAFAYSFYSGGFLFNRFDLAIALTIISGSSLARTLFFSILVGQNRLRLHSAIALVDSLVPSVVVVGAYILKMITVDFLIWLQAISGAFVFILLAVASIRRLHFQVNLKFFRQSLRYAYKSWLNNLFNQLIYKSDLYVVGFLLGSKEVGIYSIAVLMIEKAWYFSSSICNSLFPLVKNLDSSEGAKFVISVVRKNLIFVGGSCVLIALLAKPAILLLFSSDYVGATDPLLLLIPGIIFLSVPKILVSHLAAKDKLEYAAFSSGTSLVLNIILNFLLIPIWGIEGAAVASSISYGLYWIMYARFYKSLTGINALNVFKKAA